MELLKYQEYRWRYTLFLRVVELVGEAAEEFRKYVVYYLQEYTLALNRIVDSDPFML